MEIRRLGGAEALVHLQALADVLADCVAGGASVNFMASFTREDSLRFFQKVLESVARNERILLAAFLDSVLVGTVQLVPATAPNQPHRADVAKLLVKRSARGQGVGAALMRQVEVESRLAGKNLLVLDTVTGSGAERLYTRLGWTAAGTIPNYALFPDGAPCDTTIFWKALL